MPFISKNYFLIKNTSFRLKFPYLLHQKDFQMNLSIIWSDQVNLLDNYIENSKVYEESF